MENKLDHEASEENSEEFRRRYSEIGNSFFDMVQKQHHLRPNSLELSAMTFAVLEIAASIMLTSESFGGDRDGFINMFHAGLKSIPKNPLKE
jgi:hypothetical protein